MVFGKLNDAYDSVKNGLEAQIALATAEQKEQLADAKLSLAELKEMIADLKEENISLRESAELLDSVEYDGVGIAWFGTQPFCSGCLGDKGKQVRLAKLNNTTFECPACKHRYYGVRAR